jgi:hypothetical protein
MIPSAKRIKARMTEASRNNMHNGRWCVGEESNAE